MEDTLIRFAKSDLRSARREGEIFICDTKIGLITLSYDRDTRSYSAVVRGLIRAMYLFHGAKAAVAAQAIAAEYNVEVVA